MPYENDVTEQTPLLNNPNQQGSSVQKQYQARIPNASSTSSAVPTTTTHGSPLKSYIYLFAAIAVVVLSVFAVCAPLPVALSDTAAEAKHDFAGLHAYNAYLSHLTEPHSVNSRAIIRMQQWLGDLAGEFQLEAKANGLNLDVIVNDTTRAVIRQDWFADSKWDKSFFLFLYSMHGSCVAHIFILRRAVVCRIPERHPPSPWPVQAR